MSMTEAWVAQAAVVAALRVEWGRIRAGTGLFRTVYALEIQAFSHLPMVVDETFRPIEAGRKETKRPSDFRKGAVLLM